MILMRENPFRWSLEGVGPEMATGEASAPFGPKKVEIFRAHSLAPTNGPRNRWGGGQIHHKGHWKWWALKIETV
jgi:hypothetical protein